MENLKEHWDRIYTSKKFEEASWYQETPATSLDLIETLNLSHDSEIIDVGGGDSYLCDYLLKLEYMNVSVLDISKNAIERAKKRLGDHAMEVNWIVSDVTGFRSEKQFDLWHDRAAFHFLTDEDQIEKYLFNLNNSLKPGGFLILGTFSEDGPEKCSGINVHNYSEVEMNKLLERDFEKISFRKIDHTTPWEAKQNFSFGVFRKK